MPTVVNSSASSVQLVGSAGGWRGGLIIYNSDANDLYIKYGATASMTDFTVKIPSGGYWEMPQPAYPGRIDGIWAADGSGSAHITEL
jgi:hypothetical protein